MSVHADRIKELLGNGLSNEVVASTVGVHPSYISQLMSDEAFYSEVVDKRTKTLASHTIRDRSLDSIEDKLITKIAQAIEDNLIYKPGDMLRAFVVINSAKRRGVTQQESTVINQTVVNLQLPKKAALRFTRNDQNEVIEVEGQTMVTMPASSLLEELMESKEGISQKERQRYDVVKKFLPTTTSPQGASLLEKTIDHLSAESAKGNPYDKRAKETNRLEGTRISDLE